MSRVGKKPIPLPKGVKVTIGSELLVEGPKGKQTVPVPAGITVRQDNGTLTIHRDTDQQAALHGLTRALTANAVTGVSTGFTRELQIFGIGYRAEVKGRVAQFVLGYSHPIVYPIPDQIKVTVDENTKLTIEGPDRRVVGQVAAELRSFYPPEPYKGKGVRYTDERVVRKEGKTVQ